MNKKRNILYQLLAKILNMYADDVLRLNGLLIGAFFVIMFIDLMPTIIGLIPVLEKAAFPLIPLIDFTFRVIIVFVNFGICILACHLIYNKHFFVLESKDGEKNNSITTDSSQ